MKNSGLGRALRLVIGLGLTLLAVSPALALGGAAAKSGAWGLSSHVVMVLGTRGTVCTGTVLAPRVIVTAAHCTAGSKQVAVAYFEDGAPVLQIVTAVARHPGFSRNSAVSVDIALLRLENPLPSRFQPVSIDHGGAAGHIGESLTIAGFGLADERDAKSAGTLRTAEVELLPKLYPRFLRLGLDSQLSSLAICKGDSGGPVFAGGSGAPVLVGVVYAAERTGKAKACGAAAQAVRVSPQRGWIDGVMARW
ncbi:MAG: trypsin-like serine protease [Proteobacteria bacterium]|nr:trypsin-like serine protease [Pseudomonadota bacterium]